MMDLFVESESRGLKKRKIPTMDNTIKKKYQRNKQGDKHVLRCLNGNGLGNKDKKKKGK